MKTINHKFKSEYLSVSRTRSGITKTVFFSDTELAADPQKTARKIFKFLGIKLKKQ